MSLSIAERQAAAESLQFVVTKRFFCICVFQHCKFTGSISVPNVVVTVNMLGGGLFWLGILS